MRMPSLRFIISKSVIWPHDEVKAICRQAFNAVRDGQPLKATVRVTHCYERAYRGRATWPDRVMLRIPRGIGVNYCIRRNGKNNPNLATWQDCLAFLAGHEFHHIWQFQMKKKVTEFGANEAGRFAMACRGGEKKV